MPHPANPPGPGGRWPLPPIPETCRPARAWHFGVKADVESFCGHLGDRPARKGRSSPEALGDRCVDGGRYTCCVGVIEAAGWGVAGGLVLGLISMAAEVTKARFRWPWRASVDGVWPRLFVFMVGLVVGGLVAAAAHNHILDPWPAFIMGAGAPSVIRGALSRVEVTEGKSEERGHEVTSEGEGNR